MVMVYYVKYSWYDDLMQVFFDGEEKMDMLIEFGIFVYQIVEMLKMLMFGEIQECVFLVLELLDVLNVIFKDEEFFF